MLTHRPDRGVMCRLVAADRTARHCAARVLVWGREGRGGSLACLAAAADHRLPGIPRVLGAKLLICKPADPEAMGRHRTAE
jgi:hypothetical protein